MSLKTDFKKKTKLFTLLQNWDELPEEGVRVWALNVFDSDYKH